MKVNIDTTSFLKSIQPFNSLSKSELDRISSFFSVKSFGSNGVIFRRGDPGDYVFIIIEGEVAVQVPSKSGILQTVSSLGSGSFFGDMSVLLGERRSSTVVSTRETTVLSIDRDHFMSLNNHNPAISLYFQKMLARRVVSADEQVAELVQARDISNMQVIKEGNVFMAYNKFGDIPTNNTAGFGLYKEDTRYLCFYDLFICDERSVLLHYSCDNNYTGETEMTNPALSLNNGESLPQDVLGISRKKVISQHFEEEITIKNYSQKDAQIDVTLNFASDFRDIFEIRGIKQRSKRGINFPVNVSKDSVEYRYEGLDGKTYLMNISFSIEPKNLTENKASVDLDIPARKSRTLLFKVFTHSYDKEKHFKVISDSNSKLTKPGEQYEAWNDSCPQIKTDNVILNYIIDRSSRDLRFLQSSINGRPYYDAGTPWYSCLFGRDSIITSIQSLMLNRETPTAVLEILAGKQGRNVDKSRGEEPGKILHELRIGELANNKEIPHTPYYGSIDSTPLWIILLSEIYKWTGNKGIVEQYFENAVAANDWIDKYGDADGDQYVEYAGNFDDGLINQGWKDSTEAIMEKNGKFAQHPISLVEVQGYVYDSKKRLAGLAAIIGESKMSEYLHVQANSLRKKFNQDFYVKSGTGDFLAIALNGKKQKVESVSSNQGHALWSGILDDSIARIVSSRLFKDDMFSGWGIRTLSADELGYNPFGYHIGTVWPHDNAIIAAGLRRYGFIDESLKIFSYITKAARFFENFRLPELFCGFSSEEKFLPVPYPLACRPQAWAAGSVFMLLNSILGLEPDPENKTLNVVSPVFPKWLNRVEIKNLKLFNATLDLKFEKINGKVRVTSDNPRKIELKDEG